MEKLIDRDNEMSSYMEEIETYKVVNDYSFNRNYKKNNRTLSVAKDLAKH